MTSSSLTHKSSKESPFNNNVDVQAITQKLMPVAPHRRRSSQNNGDGDISANVSTLNRVTTATTQSINDVENIFEVMPETELAMQILVSSIMSPNDMRSPELTWSATGSKVPAPVVAEMLEVLKDHFETEYDIKSKLQSMLEDALFITGSYPLMVIPENSLDDIINSRESISMEHITPFLDGNHVCKSMGILGPSDTTVPAGKRGSGLESFFNVANAIQINSKSPIDPLVTITDNFSAVRMPEIANRMRTKNIAQAIAGKIRISNESGAKDGLPGRELTLSEVATTFYERKSSRTRHTVDIRTTDQSSRVAVGHPMTLKLPSDSIIPVHVPSDPKDHLGYYILLDMYGNPISNSKDSSYYKELTNISDARKKSVSSNILEHVSSSMYASSCGEANREDLNELEDMYSRAMERDLLARLKNGLYGQNVEIANANEIYRIMFARKCADMQTQVLYVPAELMTYVAFDYNRSGVGRSLLDKSKMLSSIRAILLFSNTMAAVNNSINSRTMNIDLSPEDMEPEQTVDLILAEWAKKDSGGLPLASTNPTDIIDGIKRAATSVVVTGNPNWPDTKVTVENNQQNNVIVDNQLDERLRERHLMSLAVNPELVDSSATIDFAIEAINRNLLFNKRLSMYQMRTEFFLADHVTKYTLNSGKLMSELIKIVTKGISPEDGQAVKDAIAEDLIDEDVLAEFPKMTASEAIADVMERLTVELPNPDNTKLSNQLDQVETYGRALDAVLPAYFSEDVLSSKGAEDSRVNFQIVKGFFLQQFVTENNIMPEIQDLFKPNGDPQIVELLERNELVSGAVSKIVDGITKRAKDTDKSTDSNDSDDGDFGGY